MKNLQKILYLSIMVLGLVVPCFAEKIVVEGSTTVLPIAQRTAEEFMGNNPDADISVRGGGSGVGIASLLAKTCDIADSSRSIKDSELDTAVTNGVDPKAHVVAMDGIAVIFNNANSVSKLTKKQLKDIYTGFSKSFIFAVIISMVGCYQGLRTKEGAVGVGEATTISVVSSFILIILADCVLTGIFYFSNM